VAEMKEEPVPESPKKEDKV